MSQVIKLAEQRRKQNDRQKHVDMIHDPRNWPCWPILPLKHLRRRFDDKNSLGFLIAECGPPYKIYVAPMFVLMFASKGTTIGDALKDLPVESYDDLDLLLDDWEVD